MPVASILITVFNCERYISACIQSSLDQTAADIQIVIVDDGSTDGTPGLLRQFCDKRISLMGPGRVGRSRALNIGLEHCRSDYVAILDADDVALAHRISSQAAFLDRHPAIAQGSMMRGA